jgi:hypothetical protein
VGEDAAPGIDDQGLAVRGAPASVVAHLGGGHDVGQILDRARPQEYLPVGLAGALGERGRHGQEARPPASQLAIQLGEAHVGRSDLTGWAAANEGRPRDDLLPRVHHF